MVQSLGPPTNHMEVEGNLCKLFYRKFGEEALPIIGAVFRQWGIILVENFKTVAAGDECCWGVYTRE